MYFISAVIVPFYIQWGGIKFSQILFLNAWFMFWNFLLEIPTGIFYILLAIIRYTPLVIAAIIICAGFGLTRGPLFSSYMNKYIPSDKRATILSTTSMLRTFAIVIINTISGFLADWSIPNTLIILGIAAILFTSFSKIKEAHLID